MTGSECLRYCPRFPDGFEVGEVIGEEGAGRVCLVGGFCLEYFGLQPSEDLRFAEASPSQIGWPDSQSDQPIYKPVS